MIAGGVDPNYDTNDVLGPTHQDRMDAITQFSIQNFENRMDQLDREREQFTDMLNQQDMRAHPVRRGGVRVRQMETYCAPSRPRGRARAARPHRQGPLSCRLSLKRSRVLGSSSQRYLITAHCVHGRRTGWSPPAALAARCAFDARRFHAHSRSIAIRAGLAVA